MASYYGYEALRTVIRDRAPLLMIDRLEVADDGRSARGVKAVSMAEDFFLGHFPGNPIMPGVLQIAAMAQLGEAALRAADALDEEALLVLSALKRVKFRRPVVPGDRLDVAVSLAASGEGEWTFEAKVLVGDDAASSATLTLKRLDRAVALTPPAALAVALPPELANTVADSTAILGMIPHRYPFLLVDRILRVDAARVVGLKNVTGNEAILRGLAEPLFPGFLQIEAAAQTACARALQLPENQGKLGYFMSVDEASFHAPVQPGDQLLMDVTMEMRGRFGLAKAVLSVGNRTVTEAAMKFAIVDRPGAA